jgi:predicted alpha/beta-fold hydrolase
MSKIFDRIAYSVVSKVRPTGTRMIQTLLYNKWQKKYQKPTEVKTVESKQGGLLEYDKFVNNPNNKKLLIFLHGYYGSKKEFALMTKKDEEKDYDLITYDLYSKNQKVKSRYTYGVFEAIDLNTIVENENEYQEIYLIGHSLGAASVVKYISEYDSARVKKAIAIAIFKNFTEALEKNAQAINKTIFSNRVFINAQEVAKLYLEKMQIDLTKLDNIKLINQNSQKTTVVFGGKDLRAPYFKTNAQTIIIPEAEHDDFFTKNFKTTEAIIMQHCK